MAGMDNTQFVKVDNASAGEVSDVLRRVYEAMEEKGYSPVNQIVGYIMSGDPTYITSHNNARSIIRRVERDEIVEELLDFYIENKAWKKD